MRLLVATRNPGKVREIREILGDAGGGVEMVGLHQLGIAETAEEDALEAFPSFEQNAAAKARHFAALSGMPTLADDSGICVDALDGAPGVHSRRFAPGQPQRGEGQDQANNRHLLGLLRGVPAERRTAHYVCAAALAGVGAEVRVFSGRCDGVVLQAARGEGGFGYDPLFYLPGEGMTFGELPAARKNQISHRALAIRAALQALREAPRG